MAVAKARVEEIAGEIEAAPSVEEQALKNLSERSAAVQTAKGERDKRVFSDRSKVAELFLLGEESREPRPHVRSRTDGVSCRSYRTVIARKAVNGVVLDPSRYSTTTRTHQNAVRGTCRRADVPTIEVPFEVLRDLGVAAEDVYIVDGGTSRAVFHCDGETYYRGNNGDDGLRWRHLGFVVQLPTHAETVDEAEQLLIPDRVSRAEADGLSVTRQGEWFFIPREGHSPRGVLRKPLQEASGANGELGPSHREYRDKDLGAHVARDKVREIPTECPECGETSFRYDEDVECIGCGETVGPTLYVRGTVRHLDHDHRVINLGETWHEAVTHGFPGVSFDTAGRGGRYGAD